MTRCTMYPSNADFRLVSSPSARGERLEESFDRMLSLVASGDGKACDEAWDGFVRELERHMVVAEERIFPVLAEAHERGQAEVARLREGHARVRRTLEELGVLIQLRAGQHAVVPAVEALRRIARDERASLYASLRSVVAATH